MIFKNFFILVFIVLVFTSDSYSQIVIPDKVKQGIVIDHSSGAVLAEKMLIKKYLLLQ
jgi:D-alanyl-D-alanine carboxypeptidase